MPDLADDLNNIVNDPAAQPLLDAVKKHRLMGKSKRKLKKILKEI